MTPFFGTSGTGAGVQATADLRGYYPMGDRLVLAGRAQFGIVQGPGLADTPRDFLFYSGGGGSVRGQPYRSLGVTSGGGRFWRSGLCSDLAGIADARDRGTGDRRLFWTQAMCRKGHFPAHPTGMPGRVLGCATIPSSARCGWMWVCRLAAAPAMARSFTLASGRHSDAQMDSCRLRCSGA